MKNLEKTKKILIKKAKYEYRRDFLRLDIEEKELNEYVNEIKKTKTLKKLDKITYNLFHY